MKRCYLCDKKPSDWAKDIEIKGFGKISFCGLCCKKNDVRYSEISKAVICFAKQGQKVHFFENFKQLQNWYNQEEENEFDNYEFGYYSDKTWNSHLKDAWLHKNNEGSMSNTELKSLITSRTSSSLNIGWVGHKVGNSFVAETFDLNEDSSSVLETIEEYEKQHNLINVPRIMGTESLVQQYCSGDYLKRVIGNFTYEQLQKTLVSLELKGLRGKYDSNEMIASPELLQKLTNKLNVDISSLTSKKRQLAKQLVSDAKKTKIN